MNTIGGRIRDARLARGWSRTTLAAEAGITTSELEAIEANQSAAGRNHVLAALQLQEVHLVAQAMTANFLETVQPMVAEIDATALPSALSEVMAVLARYASGAQPPAATTQVNIVNVGSADIDHPPASD